jgi:hypothetical protein
MPWNILTGTDVQEGLMLCLAADVVLSILVESAVMLMDGTSIASAKF